MEGLQWFGWQFCMWRYWWVSVGFVYKSVVMQPLFNITLTLRNTTDLRDLSTVNLIVGWKLLISSTNTSRCSSPCSQIQEDVVSIFSPCVWYQSGRRLLCKCGNYTSLQQYKIEHVSLGDKDILIFLFHKHTKVIPCMVHPITFLPFPSQTAAKSWCTRRNVTGVKWLMLFDAVLLFPMVTSIDKCLILFILVLKILISRCVNV